MGTVAMNLSFLKVSFKPTFWLSSFTFIKRLFSSSLLPAIRVVLSAYRRSWTKHSRFLCNIAPYSIGPCFCHQSHTQLGVVFTLALSSSVFLELFLHWSPVLYWVPTCLRVNLSVSYLFAFFILFMGFSRQEYWSGLPFPSPVDHILLELSTMTHPSMVALHSMAHSFIDLHKAVVHVTSLISFLWLWFSFCLSSDG